MGPHRRTASGLYAITSEAVCADESRLLAAVTAALKGGAVWVQYRDKRADAAQRVFRAQLLSRLCRDAGARLIVNDDAALALEAGADGVHLGQQDGSIRQARLRLGPKALIGASCASSLERARAAVSEGADYVAFGRFFPSKTKPDAPQARVEWLAEARAALDVPICAIGGITPDNALPLLQHGADLLAAVDGVFGGTDIRAAAAAYTRLFDPRS